jgi:RNA polymerase sigma-70 factor (ECF subfamily)
VVALVPLEDQDRNRWDRAAIGDGGQILERSLGLTQGELPGRFATQAAIEAVHLEAPSFAQTDWVQLFALYTVLDVVTPSPLVKLNRAVVLAHIAGPEAGLAAIDAMELAADASVGPILAIARADLLRQAGEWSLAADAYRIAISAMNNDAQRAFLVGRLAEMEDAIIRS